MKPSNIYKKLYKLDNNEIDFYIIQKGFEKLEEYEEKIKNLKNGEFLQISLKDCSRTFIKFLVSFAIRNEKKLSVVECLDLAYINIKSNNFIKELNKDILTNTYYGTYRTYNDVYEDIKRK